MTADPIQAAKERLTRAIEEAEKRHYTGAVVDVADLRTLLAEPSRLEGENERLRLTILGGEDAPGYAASLPIEAVEEAHRANMASWHADTDTVLAMEAALTSDEEPDDYVPTPQQRAEDYSRWARATYKSYREWLERATNAETALAEARREIAEQREALKPFAGEFAATFVNEHGWTGPMNKERIVDWFGPSDFRRAASLLSTEPAGGGEKAQRVVHDCPHDRVVDEFDVDDETHVARCLQCGAALVRDGHAALQQRRDAS